MEEEEKTFLLKTSSGRYKQCKLPEMFDQVSTSHRGFVTVQLLAYLFEQVDELQQKVNSLEKEGRRLNV